MAADMDESLATRLCKHGNCLVVVFAHSCPQVGSKKDHKEEPASNVPKALMSSEQLAKKRDELLVRVDT
jgi:hypothetical protein